MRGIADYLRNPAGLSLSGSRFATGFAVVLAVAYGVVFLLLAFAGVYWLILDLILVNVAIVAALFVAVRVATGQLSWVPEERASRSRERSGWGLMAVALAMVLAGRLAYGWDELFGASPGRSIAWVDLMFALLFVVLITGLLTIPRKHERRHV